MTGSEDGLTRGEIRSKISKQKISIYARKKFYKKCRILFKQYHILIL